MKILLINPYISDEIVSFFPIGLSYIARALLQKGHKVKVLDLNAYRIDEKGLKLEIKDEQFELIGITGMIRGYENIQKIVPIIRQFQPKAKIVLGGSLATSMPTFLLENLKIDIIVKGEGEDTITELVHCLENRKKLSGIKGLVYKERGKIISTDLRGFCPNPDKFGFPAWELFPMEEYKKSPIYDYVDPHFDKEDRRDIGILSSRGCCYNCSYCDHQIKGYTIRIHSLDYVFEQIKILMKQYNIRNFFFWDDIFAFNKKRVLEFCERIKNESLDISWTCNGHVNLSDYEMYCQMKKAGCFSIRFGIESGSQHILDTYNKKVTVENAMKAIRQARRAGLNTILYIMIGMIGETEETVQETVDFIDKTFKPLDLNIAPPIIQYFYVTPIPGTALFQQAQDLGKVGSLESYMEKLPNFHNKLTINLTDMPNEKLIILKNDLEEKIGQVISKRYYRFLSIASELAVESGVKN